MTLEFSTFLFSVRFLSENTLILFETKTQSFLVKKKRRTTKESNEKKIINNQSFSKVSLIETFPFSQSRQDFLKKIKFKSEICSTKKKMEMEMIPKWNSLLNEFLENCEFIHFLLRFLSSLYNTPQQHNKKLIHKSQENASLTPSMSVDFISFWQSKITTGKWEVVGGNCGNFCSKHAFLSIFFVYRFAKSRLTCFSPPRGDEEKILHLGRISREEFTNKNNQTWRSEVVEEKNK